MLRRMFLSKIHRAVVTHANLHYEGSCTIDTDLLEAADILNNQEIHIWNITRGSRLITYALEGPRGSGVVCVNGAAAHLTKPGDMVIIAAFGEMTHDEARQFEPKVVVVDEKNRIKSIRAEVPGPQMPKTYDEMGLV
ncbi:MAG: aspartate 1-decarboxylase [Deltaproteobacteria bacterium]|nr:aspartate 1-decarboxylase [Deltaproteobacteria bacterium]